MEAKQQPTPNPLTEQPVNKKNPLIPGLIILTIILLGTSICFALQYFQLRKETSDTQLTTSPPIPTSTLNPTSTNVPASNPTEPSVTNNLESTDQQTYTNEKYGYEFQYSQDYYLLDTPDHNTILICHSGRLDKGIFPERPCLIIAPENISYADIKNELTTQGFKLEESKHIFGINQSITADSIKFDQETSEGRSTVAISFFSHNNQNFTIKSSTYLAPSFQSDILKTFKFTN